VVQFLFDRFTPLYTTLTSLTLGDVTSVLHAIVQLCPEPYDRTSKDTVVQSSNLSEKTVGACLQYLKSLGDVIAYRQERKGHRHEIFPFDIRRCEKLMLHWRSPDLTTTDLEKIKAQYLEQNRPPLKSSSANRLTALFEMLDNPNTSKEVKRAGWTELQRLAMSSRIWEPRIFWQFLDRVFKTRDQMKRNQNHSAISEAVEVLRIAAWASNRSGSKGRASKEAKRKYLEYLKNILSQTSVSKVGLRARVMALLYEILSPKELFDICFGLWKSDAHNISANVEYLARIQVYLPQLDNPRLLDDKQRDELYQLLDSDNAKLKQRALDRWNGLRSSSVA